MDDFTVNDEIGIQGGELICNERIDVGILILIAGEEPGFITFFGADHPVAVEL